MASSSSISRKGINKSSHQITIKNIAYGGEISQYVPLYKATLKGNWAVAKAIIDENPRAITAKLTSMNETMLHIAVGAGGDIRFIEELLKLLSDEQVRHRDYRGNTALVVAAMVGNTRAAQLLINRIPDILNVRGNDGKLLPIHVAATYGQKDMVSLLMESYKSYPPGHGWLNESSGAELLHYLIHAGFFDTAIELVQDHPILAAKEFKGSSPLYVLTAQPSAFKRGSDFSFRDYVRQHFEHRKRVKETRLNQHYAVELVKLLCMKIMELDDDKAFDILKKSLYLAAKLGAREIIEEILDVSPHSIWLSDGNYENFFWVAILHRQESVFNLLYQVTEYKRTLMEGIHGDEKNNMLHFVGKLPPEECLDVVSGPALQMQREVIWFQEVEKYVRPAYKVQRNKHGKTPMMVFHEEHKQLVREAEKWMKETATACIIVATVVATVAFSAIITVPGGNDQTSGLPLLIKSRNTTLRRIITTFGVCDAISLFSSMASILMFLSFFTARYSETEFVRSLPTRLLIGLSTLGISLTSLLMAFGCAFYLLFCQNKAWTLAPIIAFSVVPLAFYVSLQFHIIKEALALTYGSNAFRKQGHCVLH